MKPIHLDKYLWYKLLQKYFLQVGPTSQMWEKNIEYAYHIYIYSQKAKRTKENCILLRASVPIANEMHFILLVGI